MQSLNQKLESAAGKLIAAAGVDAVVQLGLDGEVKSVPSVTATVTGGNESPIGSGNFMLNLAIECKGNADDLNVDQFRAFCDSALAPMMSDDLANELSPQESAFIVFGVVNRQSREAIDDRSFIAELSMDVVCCNGFT